MRAGNVLIWLGIGAIVVGIMVRLGWFSWFGSLPGDIRSESPRGGFFFPITSSLLVSVIATIVINLVVRILRDR